MVRTLNRTFHIFLYPYQPFLPHMHKAQGVDSVSFSPGNSRMLGSAQRAWGSACSRVHMDGCRIFERGLSQGGLGQSPVGDLVSRSISALSNRASQFISLSIAYSTLSSLRIENSTQLKLFFFHFMITSSMMIDVVSQVACLCLLDLSATFSTIDHCLSKWFVLHGAVLNWVKSYLSNLLFRVKCSNQLSEPHHSSYGVPQGSVLGPLVFTLYTTPLSSLISSSVNHHLYADDTQLFLSFQASDFNASWSPTSTQQNSQSCASFQQWHICFSSSFSSQSWYYL